MRVLIHYFKIVFKILSTRFTYSRIQLLWSYTKLMSKSIVHHKFNSRKRSPEDRVHEGTIMGFSVRFFDYIQLITLFEEIFVHSVYKFSTDTNHPFIVDAGSNIGLSVLFFKKLYPASRVIAFEPDSQTFALLEYNIRNNQLTDVACYKTALANSVGLANLYKGSTPGSLGITLIETPDAYPETIQVSRLSDFIHNDMDLLKIDVEGSETQIIEDLLETGAIQFVKQMIIEFHPSKIARDIQDFLEELSNCGFDFCEQNEAFPKSSDRLFYFRQRLT